MPLDVQVEISVGRWADQLSGERLGWRCYLESIKVVWKAVRLDSPGGNQRREEGQWLIPACLVVGDWRGKKELTKQQSSL